MNIFKLKCCAGESAPRLRRELEKKTPINCSFFSLLLLGVLSVIGCNQQSQPVAVAPTAAPVALNAVEKKFVANAKGMSPQQQAEFFRKNPEMMRKASVMSTLRAELPRVQVRQTRGEKPRLNTGRPDTMR